MKTKISKSTIIFSVALVALMCLSGKQSLAQIQGVASRLKFVDVSERLKNANHNLEVVIVSWNEWGRKKKGCKGLGLCDPHWFPEVQEISVGGGASIIEFNQTSSSYYFDILLAENPPSEIPQADLILEIDDDILLSTKSVIGKDLTIQNGQYLLDTSLGKFGGFRVRVN